MDLLNDKQFPPEKCVSVLKSRMKCSYCPSVFVGCFNLTTHLKRKHRVEVKLTCKLCWKIFFVPIVYHKHLLDHGHVPGVTGELLDELKNGYITNWQRRKINRERKLLEEQQEQLQKQEHEQNQIEIKPEENWSESKNNNSGEQEEKEEKNSSVFKGQEILRKSRQISCSRCDETFETVKEFAIHSVSHVRIDARIQCSKCSDYFARSEDYFGHSCCRSEISFESALPPSEIIPESPDRPLPSPVSFEDSAPTPPEFIEFDDVSPGQPLSPRAVVSTGFPEALFDPKDSVPFTSSETKVLADSAVEHASNADEAGGPVILNVCSFTGNPEPKKSYDCGICNAPNGCPQTFKTQNELTIHAASHIQIDARIRCYSCSNYFVLPEVYFGHSCLQESIPDSADPPLSPISSEDSKKPSYRRVIHNCGICSESFKRKGHFISHQLLHHPEVKNILCTICAQQFQTPSEKQEHIRTKHNWKLRPPPSTICEICGKTLYKNHVKHHMETVHSEATYPCEDCGKVCKSVHQLKTHKLTHLPEKPVSCPFCSYRCTVGAERIQHLAWKHLGPAGFQELDVQPGVELPFKCSECDREYTTQVALDEHRKFHGKRTYKCKHCHWKCFTNYHVQAHNIAFHSTGLNNVVRPVPWLCKFCSESSPNRWEIYVHEVKCPQRTNTGLDVPKPANLKQTDPVAADSPSNYVRKTPDGGWQCDECDKISKTKADALYHYRAVHSGTYLYICEVCGRGTNSKSNMKVHMRSHGGGFECLICGERFQKSKELRVHKQNVHRASSFNGKSGGTTGYKKRSRTDGRLLEALVGLDGEEGYKVALMPKQ